MPLAMFCFRSKSVIEEVIIVCFVSLYRYMLYNYAIVVTMNELTNRSLISDGLMN